MHAHTLHREGEAQKGAGWVKTMQVSWAIGGGVSSTSLPPPSPTLPPLPQKCIFLSEDGCRAPQPCRHSRAPQQVCYVVRELRSGLQGIVAGDAGSQLRGVGVGVSGRGGVWVLGG